MKEQRKAYVRIQSQKTIQVTSGLQNKDVTNPDAHIPDRLKISPEWPRCTCIIYEGAHVYPSQIVDWPTVQALQKDNILTIGEYLDTADEQTVAKAEDLKRELASMEQNQQKEQAKAGSLADIAGE